MCEFSKVLYTPCQHVTVETKFCSTVAPPASSSSFIPKPCKDAKASVHPVYHPCFNCIRMYCLKKARKVGDGGNDENVDDEYMSKYVNLS